MQPVDIVSVVGVQQGGQRLWVNLADNRVDGLLVGVFDREAELLERTVCRPGPVLTSDDTWRRLERGGADWRCTHLVMMGKSGKSGGVSGFFLWSFC